MTRPRPRLRAASGPLYPIPPSSQYAIGLARSRGGAGYPPRVPVARPPLSHGRSRDGVGTARSLPSRVGAIQPRVAALVVAAIAIVLRIPLLFDRYDDRFAPDSGLYLKLADTLLGGLHYPDDYRVPGYPSVIALLQLLPGRRED